LAKIENKDANASPLLSHSQSAYVSLDSPSKSKVPDQDQIKNDQQSLVCLQPGFDDAAGAQAALAKQKPPFSSKYGNYESQILN